jgi:hypothetical protein
MFGLSIQILYYISCFFFFFFVSCKSHHFFLKTTDQWRSVFHCIKFTETYKAWWLHKALCTQEHVPADLFFSIIFPSIIETWVNAAIRPHVTFNACERVKIMKFIINCFFQLCFYILARLNSSTNVLPLQYLETLLLFRYRESSSSLK